MTTPLPLRVLILEDHPADAEMMLDELRGAGYEPDYQLVASAADYAARLNLHLDLILADYSLPQFDAPSALRLLQQRQLDIPFIIVSGTVGEEQAVALIKQGATDYLLKDRLGRLGIAVTQALEAKRLRDEQQQAQVALRASEERFRALVQHSTDVITILAADMTVLYESPSLEKVMGYRPEAVQGLNITDVIHPDDLPLIVERMSTILDQPAATFAVEVRLRHADGSWRLQEATVTNLLDHPAIHGIVVNSRDITERKQTEAQLATQAKLLDQVSDSIIKLDINDIIEFWNRGSERLYGWSAEEVTGKLLADVIQTQVVNDTMENAVRRVLDTGGWNGEFVQTRKDGTSLPVLNATTLLRDGHGNPVGYVGINRDITERKQAEDALKASEIRYRRLFEAAKDGILILDASSGRIEDVNPYLSELLGYPAGEFLGKQLWEIGAFKNKADSIISFAKLQSQKQVRYEDLPLEASDGRLIAVEFVSNVYSAGDRDVIQCYIRDITARKREEAELERYREHLEELVDQRTAELNHAKQRLEGILDNATEGIVLAYLERGIEQTNTMFNTLFQCAPDSYFGQPLLMLVLPEDRDRLTALLQSVIADRQGRHDEFLALRADQTTFEVQLGLGYAHSSDETDMGLVCSFQDITERKRTQAVLQEGEARLRESEQMLQTVLETLPVRVFWKDRDSNYLGANHLYVQDAGFTASEQIIGKSDLELSGRSHATEYQAGDQAVIESGLPRLEIEEQVIRADGSLVWVQTNKIPLRDSSGAIRGVLGAYIDITKLKQAEAILQRALEEQKELVALKAHFISMTSHDFRTPMTVILSSLDLLEMQIARQFGAAQIEPLQRRFSRIKESVQHMTSLLDDVLVVNRSDTGKVEIKLEAFDLENVCRDIFQEIQLSASTQHVLTYTFGGAATRIVSDKQIVRQILINLLSNAVKYSPNGGPVQLEVHADAQGVEFRVEDAGIGIPETDQARLFETFHRAHNVGEIQGTGLGMAIVKRAVDALKGTIVFESQPGVGTTFTVRLPTAAKTDGSSS